MHAMVDCRRRREKLPEAISAYSPSCFWSILGDCLSHEEHSLEDKEGGTLQEVISKGPFF